LDATGSIMPYSPLELADAFIRAGELEDALDALNQHLATVDGDQRDETLRLRAAVLARFPDQPARLRAALADYAALPSPTAEDEDRRAALHEQLGDARSAAEALERARVLAPDDDRLTERQIALLVDHGWLDEAMVITTALPETWRWLLWRGDIALARKRDADALGQYTAALAHFEAHVDQSSRLAMNLKAQILIKRARAYRHLKRCIEAEADYRGAEAIIPNDPTLMFNRGLLAYDCKGLRHALPLCRDALDLAPPGLREWMRQKLREDPRYRALAGALLP
jgi:predicted negative regulator of RcsB-dependent stress response